MRRTDRIALLSLCFLLFFPLKSALGGREGAVAEKTASRTVWTRESPDPAFTYKGFKPGCARGDPFIFYSRKGGLNDLVIFFQGGGACWDSSNCIAHPTCTQRIDGKTDVFAHGIFDLENPANPFKEWSFVIIPYCTGDLHIGAHDASYSHEGKNIAFHHRGFVNFRAVLDWMPKHFDAPGKILVTGSSAGSYGALFNFAYVQKTYPEADCFLLSDAGNGVVTDDFLRKALDEWRLLENLPDWIPGLEELFSNASAFPRLFERVAHFFPDKDMGQYTTAYDSVQVYFYNLMLCIDAGVFDPKVWDEINPAVTAEWHRKMLQQVHFVAGRAANYAYFIGPGKDHTILGRPKFYSKDSVGPPFVDWLEKLVQNRDVQSLQAN